MTKAISDILGRLVGDLVAVQGLAARLRPAEGLPHSPSLTYVQEAGASPPPPPGPTVVLREDLELAKKLLEEIKGFIGSAVEQIDAELKPAPLPEGAGEAGGASAPKTSSKAK